MTTNTRLFFYEKQRRTHEGLQWKAGRQRRDVNDGNYGRRPELTNRGAHTGHRSTRRRMVGPSYCYCILIFRKRKARRSGGDLFILCVFPTLLLITFREQVQTNSTVRFSHGTTVWHSGSVSFLLIRLLNFSSHACCKRGFCYWGKRERREEYLPRVTRVYNETGTVPPWDSFLRVWGGGTRGVSDW